MDRPLPSAVTRRRRLRVVGTTVLILSLIGAAAAVVPDWVRPSVSRQRIRTAEVVRGPLDATVTAWGHAIPAAEHVIVSPIATRLESVLVAPGDTVDADVRLVVLDVDASSRAVRKIDDQIALKQNERAATELDLRKKVAELEGQRDLRAVEIRSFELEVERAQTMIDQEVGTLDALREAEVDLEHARIQHRQAITSIDLEREVAEATLAKLALEERILAGDRATAQATLDAAVARAGRAGVVTSVLTDVGRQVAPGDELARIADLSRFRIEATISDHHVERIGPGLPAAVMVADHTLPGRITEVRPTVEGGTITLVVDLDDPSHPALRHRLRTEVHITTDHRESTTFVERPAFVTLDGRRHLYVIHDDVAVRTPVEFGITSFEYQEIVRGLAPGDAIILSDMSDHANAREVRLR